MLAVVCAAAVRRSSLLFAWLFAACACSFFVDIICEYKFEFFLKPDMQSETEMRGLGYMGGVMCDGWWHGSMIRFYD